MASFEFSYNFVSYSFKDASNEIDHGAGNMVIKRR